MIITKTLRTALFWDFFLLYKQKFLTYQKVWVHNVLAFCQPETTFFRNDDEPLAEKCFCCCIIPAYCIGCRLLQLSPCINKQLWAKYCTKIDETHRSYKDTLQLMEVFAKERQQKHHTGKSITSSGYESCKKYSRIHQYIKRGGLWQL